MRQALVMGNWKMNGSLGANAQLLEGLLSLSVGSVEVSVCPPLLYVPQVAEALKGSVIKLGAQNLCALEQTSGAFTGEVSAQMLTEFDVAYVLVGHSERRELFADDNTAVTQKFSQVQQAGMTPVLCIGESLAQREAGETLAFITSQLDAVVDELGVEAMDNAVVAYEPIWAIGTGMTASPEQAQEVHAHIRAYLIQKNESIGQKTRILYGGSVNADNAETLFAMEDIDGALVGGASLKSDSFGAICSAAEK